MKDLDNLPDFYTQRDVDKARRNHRLMGRVEGAVAIVAFGAIWNMVGWIPSLLVLAVVGYVLWRLLSKSKSSDE
ncbi:MAG: hypothetical protein OEU54_08290 [Gemmatimonadota bacterium]|nr:hypothetical protein [Gemmatimonadota bacterium]